MVDILGRIRFVMPLQFLVYILKWDNNKSSLKVFSHQNSSWKSDY